MIQRDRVREHSPEKFNQRIDRATQRRVLRAGGESKVALSRRLEQLDGEWDMERVLQTNAAALALGGVLLGLFVNRKFFIIPCFVLPFLLQHAIQGWCPPVPMFRSPRLMVTVSFGSTAPLAGLQFSETSAAPAGPIVARKSSLVMAPIPWLLLITPFTEPDRLTKNVWLVLLKRVPMTATFIGLLVSPGLNTTTPLVL